MKKYIKFLSVLCSLVLFTSCDLGDDPNYELNDQGPNLLGFVNATLNASVVSDGEENPFILPIQLSGPTASAYTGEFTANIEVDPASTAIEGVHFSLSSSTVTISSTNNLIANFPLTILTEGIVPPLEENPILILKIAETSDNSIVPNGRTSSIRINIEYLCFSEITGSYSATFAEYYRLGVLTYTTGDWPAETEIIFLCGSTYRVLEYFGAEAFPGNEWYFNVDGAGNITYPATTPDGTPQTGNDQPFISCGTNPGDMAPVPCGPSTDRAVINGDNVTLYMSFGYLTPGSGPRTFYHELEKIID